MPLSPRHGFIRGKGLLSRQALRLIEDAALVTFQVEEVVAAQFLRDEPRLSCWQCLASAVINTPDGGLIFLSSGASAGIPWLFSAMGTGSSVRRK